MDGCVRGVGWEVNRCGCRNVSVAEGSQCGPLQLHRVCWVSARCGRQDVLSAREFTSVSGSGQCAGHGSAPSPMPSLVSPFRLRTCMTSRSRDGVTDWTGRNAYHQRCGLGRTTRGLKGVRSPNPTGRSAERPHSNRWRGDTSPTLGVPGAKIDDFASCPTVHGARSAARTGRDVHHRRPD